MNLVRLAVFTLLIGVLSRGSILASDVPLKAEIVRKAARAVPLYELTVRFTNISSAPVSIVRGSLPGGPSYNFKVREKGGKEIPDSAGFCGYFGLDEPRQPVPEEWTATLQPNQSVEISVSSRWVIPEDGEYQVSFSYVMPEKISWMCRYDFPAHIWRGSVRAEDVSLRFEAYKNARPELAVTVSSLKRTCEMLDALRSSDSSGLAGSIATRLVELGDHGAAPSLERAVERGILGPLVTALGRLGDEKSFAVLLRAVDRHKDMSAVDGLTLLVSRSNLPVEIWMGANKHVVQSPEEVIAWWKEWWEDSKGQFKIVKPARPVRREAQTSASTRAPNAVPSFLPAKDLSR